MRCHDLYQKHRLLEGEVAGQFLAAVLSKARVKVLLSSDHFSATRQTPATQLTLPRHRRH